MQRARGRLRVRGQEIFLISLMGILNMFIQMAQGQRAFGNSGEGGSAKDTEFWS